MMPQHSIWNFILWVHFTALGFWTGGIVFLSFVAAPSVHQSILAKSMAGELVGRMLKRFNYLEIFCFGVLLTTILSSFRCHPKDERLSFALLADILLMGAFTFFYSAVLSHQMEQLKNQMSSFENANPSEPVQAEFKKLHRLYVSLMTLNLLLGAAAVYGSVWWVSG